MSRLKRLISEIHHRSLWQVLLIYVGAGWIVFEIVQTVTEGLGLPQWFPAFAALLLLIGLPVVLATAFVREGEVAAALPDPTLIPVDEARTEVARRRRYLTWRNAGLSFLVALALWGVVAAAWLLFEGRPERETIQSATTPAPGIAVLPFRVVGPGLEFWREGMVDVLSTNLEGAAGLRAIDPRAVLSKWRSEIGEGVEASDREAALEVARELGASYALLGSMVGSAQEVRLTAEVYELRGGDLQGTTRREGSPDSMLALVEALSMDVLRVGLVRSTAGLPQLAVSRVTTSSIDALKAYLAGEQLYRRSRVAESAVEFRRAVEADSTFALALYRLSSAYAWSEGFSPRVSEYAKRALYLSNRLAEREALHLRGGLEYDYGSLSAIETLEELSTRYPDDAEGWYQLGEAYFHIGDQGLHPHEEFRTAFRRAIDLDPTFGPAYHHLIHDAFTRMDSAGARTLIARYRGLGPASPIAIGNNLAYALAWGDSVSRAEAQAALDTAAAEVLSSALWPLYWGSGEYADQLLHVSQALSDERHPLAYRESGQSRLEAAYLIRGQLRQARDVYKARAGEEPFGVTPSRHYLGLHLAGYSDTLTVSRAAQVLAADPVPVDRFLVGAFAATEGRWEYAEEEARALELGAQEADSQDDTLAATEGLALAQALRGYVALRRGAGQIAVQTLEEALPKLPGHGPGFTRSVVHALLRYEMGRLLLDLPRPREAERYFRSLVKSQAVIGAPTEFYLGQTYEALGNLEEAKFHYGRFVRWWENCDPELRPWWERGREALVRLTREPKA
jgi:TolB-like protein/Flp pilus assembly protein TadD